MLSVPGLAAMTLADRLDAIAGTRVVCVGDIMLDRFSYGAVERISPEAPIPVIRVSDERAMLGGAGNVVRNLGALGVKSCFVSVVGSDMAGRELSRLLSEDGSVEAHLLVDPSRRTTVKLRYVTGGHQLLRADYEAVAPLLPATADLFRTRATAGLEKAAALVVSDYGKGALDRAVLNSLISVAHERKCPVVIDPKGDDYSRYSGASVLTPNLGELAEGIKMPVRTEADIVAAGRSVIEVHDVHAVLVTRGADGMTLIEKGGSVTHLRSLAREVYDVMGAGDTVVAVLGAAVGAGIELVEAAKLANTAAGIVVAKTLTAVARTSEIRRALRTEDLSPGNNKVVSLEEAVQRAASWRERALTVGFTNGCFDLLHPGHISLLMQAKSACDRLIVGANSDDSVRRLKGPNRPVYSEAARGVVLGSLEPVDLVVFFEEDTPVELVEAIRPDVLVKGKDYTVENTVGADVVQSYGGKILLADLEPGYSTTGIIRRVAG